MTAKLVASLTPAARATKESQVVCRAIFALQEDLGITTKELMAILGADRKTLGRWKEGGRIPNLQGHLRQASSHLIAIYRSVLAMFANSSDRKLWLQTEHIELIQAPITLMQDLEGLIRVRRYLDYVRGRGA